MDTRGRSADPTSRVPALVLAAAMAAVLAGCATHHAGPPTRPAPGRDGPESRPPPDLDKVPDAVPKIEPIRAGGPNKPYEIDGRTYVPITDDRPVVERGLASWYGRKFQGRRTSSGEAYNMYAMTAAHPTLPIPSYARVRNPANGREVIVRVNDRGPFSPGRIIDLSYTAALKLGVLGGVAPVEVERITAEEIRSGAAFKRGAAPPEKEVARAPSSSTAAPAPVPVASPVPAPVAPVGTGTAAAVATAIAGPPAGLPMPSSAAPASAASGPDLATLVRGPLVAPGGASAASSTAAVPSAVPEAAASASPASSSASSAPAPAASAPPSADAKSDTRPVDIGHAYTPAAVGYWLQLGAYQKRDGALNFQRQVSEQEPWLAPLLAVYSDHGLYKLQAGPYPTKDEARAAAEHVRQSLQLVPSVVEKR